MGSQGSKLGKPSQAQPEEHSKKRNLFVKKKQHYNKAILQAEKSSIIGESDTTTRKCDSPVDNAAAKISERYEQEKLALLQAKSCASCIISQHPETRATTETSKSSTTVVATPWLSTNTTPPDSTRKRSSEWSTHSLVRKKVTSQEVMLNLFVHPSSQVDRRKEKERQQRLHYLLKRIWNGIYRAELVNPSMIVNWCCGIGQWDVEMATLFPDAKVIGVDYKEAMSSQTQHDLPNLAFHYAVIHDTYTGLESFKDDSVDFVMMRDTWLMNAPSWKWDNVFRAIFRILKPGGWIEVEEHTLSIASDGPYGKRLHQLFDALFSEIQVDRYIAQKLDSHLKHAGFTDINKQAVTLPLGEWGSTEALKETGFLFRDLVERRIRMLSKWLCQVNNIDTKELEQVITMTMDEEVDTYHACIDWSSYIARKP